MARLHYGADEDQVSEVLLGALKCLRGSFPCALSRSSCGPARNVSNLPTASEFVDVAEEIASKSM